MPSRMLMYSLVLVSLSTVTFLEGQAAGTGDTSSADANVVVPAPASSVPASPSLDFVRNWSSIGFLRFQQPYQPSLTDQINANMWNAAQRVSDEISVAWMGVKQNPDVAAAAVLDTAFTIVGSLYDLPPEITATAGAGASLMNSGLSGEAKDGGLSASWSEALGGAFLGPGVDAGQTTPTNIVSTGQGILSTGLGLAGNFTNFWELGVKASQPQILTFTMPAVLYPPLTSPGVGAPASASAAVADPFVIVGPRNVTIIDPAEPASPSAQDQSLVVLVDQARQRNAALIFEQQQLSQQVSDLTNEIQTAQERAATLQQQQVQQDVIVQGGYSYGGQTWLPNTDAPLATSSNGLALLQGFSKSLMQLGARAPVQQRTFIMPSPFIRSPQLTPRTQSVRPNTGSGASGPSSATCGDPWAAIHGPNLVAAIENAASYIKCLSTLPPARD